MFSNGTEYLNFLERNCDKCTHFVDYEDSSIENPCCPIEEDIATAMYEESVFPHDWLDENGSISRYDCRKRLGKDSK